MRLIFQFVFFFAGIGIGHFSSSQDLYIISLRDGGMHTDNFEEPSEFLTGKFRQLHLRDSSLALLAPNAGMIDKVDWEDLTSELTNKNVAILIHGMASDWVRGNKGMLNMYWNAKRSTGGYYHAYIAISWPGTFRMSPQSFVQANTNAVESGRLLGPLLEDLNDNSVHIDVITHSMGSKVLCKALKSSEVEIENAFLLAPSILRNQLRYGRRWHRSIGKVSRNLVIFHSVNDLAFSWSSLQHRGMGYKGMKINGKDSYRHISQVDCSHAINQKVFENTPYTPFKSRSHHTLYTQSPFVFESITGFLIQESIKKASIRK